MRQQPLTNHTEVLLPHYEVEALPLSSVRAELISSFAGYETLLENFLNNLNYEECN
jgi:hypothetical protein